MLDTETKHRIDTARDILVGKVPDPKSQVEQITIALIYKFMDDMDKESIGFGGEAVFFAGEFDKYSWTKIFDTKIGGFEMLNLYGEAIVKLNHNPNIPQLFRDIFKNAYLPYRDPETLKLFLKTINEFTYNHSEKLGDAFEYLLSVLGSQGDAGQFRTPRHIIDFIVAVLQPTKNETILDPACGTAGFLISSYKFIIEENTKKTRGDLMTPDEKKKMIQNFVGYDISPDMVRLSLVNMYLHNFIAPRIYEYDTLTSEDRWGDYFDVIMANPPFMTPKGGIKPHKKFTMQANRSEVLFVDYIAEHIHPSTGRAGVIVPEGIIFQSAKVYKALRKMLVDKNILYAVVSLPAGIFNPYAGVKTSILLMDKTLAKKTKNILFVKIENDGFDLGAQRRAIDKNDLTACLDLLHQYKEALQDNTIFESDNKNVFLVDKAKIAATADYNLSIDRYRVNENVQQSNFEMVRLGDVAEINAGNSAPQGDDFFINGMKPFYRTSDVGEVHISNNLEKAKDNVNEKAIKQFNLKLFPAKTILFPKSGASVFLNHRVMISQDGFVSSHLATIIGSKNKIIQEFLFYLLCEVDAKTLTTDQNYPSLRLSDLSNLQIPLPPLTIQQQIISKIESFQKIIDGAKQIVENYKPQIDIDEGWEMVKLGEVCEVISGYSFDSKEFSNKNTIKSIKITNVGVGKFVETVDDFLPSEFALKYKKYSVSENDIVIALTRSIIGDGLKVTLVPKSYNGALVNQRVAFIKSDSQKINNHFVFLQLNSQQTFNYIEDKARSLMQPNLSIKDLADLPILFPPLSTQQSIVTRIEQEQQLVNGNKELIKIFEGKIKEEIGKLWKKKEYEVKEAEVMMAAEK